MLDALSAAEKGETREGNMTMKMSRVWAMPNGDTFDIKPIGEFVKRYLSTSKVSVDPFARNKRWATHTNDLNPETQAEHHMDALEFLCMLRVTSVSPDLVIIDPPYSATQIKQCYEHIGMDRFYRAGEQNWKKERDVVAEIVAMGGVVLSFGWNSQGVGINRGFELEEILLVNHGAAHNDTICIAERKVKCMAEPERTPQTMRKSGASLPEIARELKMSVGEVARALR